MRTLTKIISLIAATAIALTASADSQTGKKLLLDKYEQQLKQSTTARDSVRILYSLFDLSDRQGQIKYAWNIYYTAGRADNPTAQLDMLRTLATFFSSNDSVMAELLSLTDGIENDMSKAATRTYILNQQISRKSRHPNDTQLQQALLDSITNSHDLYNENIYDKISLLYQIIQYLGVDADGVLFQECLDKYEQLIESLPASDYPLKNQFYTTAAIIHSRLNGNTEKAVQYDKKLLSIIEQLQQMYSKKKRKYRNYDINRFLSYRRMMSNYSALTKEEIETFRDSLQALHDRNPDVRRTMEKDNQAFSFYYMASGNYEKAIPALKGFLENPSLSVYQKQKFNSMLIEAAKKSGDNNTYVEAMENYIMFSKSIDSLRKISMTKEAMLRDSILDTPMLMQDFGTESKKKSVGKKTDMPIDIVASALAILLIIYMVLYFRLRMKQPTE